MRDHDPERPRQQCPHKGARYTEDVEERLAQAALEHKPVLSFEKLAEGLRHAGPPTADDVTVTSDGRRIDSREKALAWVEGMNALPRAADHGAIV